MKDNVPHSATGADKRPVSVSAVIPAYNIAEYIGRAIESVLAQTRKADEIVVVDDGSTDGTAEAIKKYVPQVKYVYQENRGLAGARNTGIRNSTCDFVAFLDGDDEWLPEFLELQMGLLERNPHLVWSTTNYRTYLHAENRGSTWVAPEYALKKLAGKEYFEEYFEACRRRMGGCGDTMVMKRTALFEVGLFDEHLRFAEDTDLWTRMACRWPQFGYVPQEGAIYSLDRPGNLTLATPNSEKMKVNCGILDRQLSLTRECGRYEAFRPCAEFMVRRWIRWLLFFRNEKPLVRYMLSQYADVLPLWYRCAVWSLTVLPAVTSFSFRAISWVVRTFHLRRIVVLPTAR
jgi:glycosyltransferase involved in cell wall biosynthesis